jgi:hypothetical protein
LTLKRSFTFRFFINFFNWGKTSSLIRRASFSASSLVVGPRYLVSEKATAPRDLSKVSISLFSKGPEGEQKYKGVDKRTLKWANSPDLAIF